VLIYPQSHDPTHLIVGGFLYGCVIKRRSETTIQG
jgi:hypothetical protein